MTAEATSRERTRPWAVGLTRAVWLAVAIPSCLVYAIALPSRLRDLLHLPADQMAAIRQVGLGPETNAVYWMSLEVVLSVGFVAAGWLIFLRRRKDPTVMLLSLALLVNGVALTPPVYALARLHPEWAQPVALLAALRFVSGVLFHYLFPSGRFASPFILILSALFLIISIPLKIYTFSPFRPLPPAQAWFDLAWFASGLAIQVHRYLRVETASERQQTKWVVFGLACGISGFALRALPIGLFPVLADPTQPAYWLFRIVGTPVAYACMLLTPITVGVSIFRYRLWEIDFVINRSLVYGALTGALVTIYVLLVLSSQWLLRGWVGVDSATVLAVSMLLIAILVHPLRDRLQRGVDRAFYRDQIDHRRAFAEFGREIRMMIDLGELLHALVQRVSTLLHVRRTVVFLRSGDGSFRAAEVGGDPLQEGTAAVATDAVSCLPHDEASLQRLASGQVVDRPTDAVFPLLVPLVAVRGTGGDLIGVLALGPRRSGRGYARDDIALLTALADQASTAISVARLIEEKSQAARGREDAEAANRAKSEFLASVSHELRTPLNAVIGYSQILGEQAADRSVDLSRSELVHDLGRIHAAGTHLLSLINEVLDLSRIEAGKMTFHPETFEVSALVDEVVGLIAPLLIRNGNRLEVQCPAGIGSMHTDRTKVRQSLFNLLGNSCKFTHAGTIALALRRERRSSGDWIVFSVRDTGVGIAPERISRLFRAFETDNSETSRQHGGVGLGLAITQHFSRMMGGDITVESWVGRGSNFTIRLPATAPAPVEEPGAEDR